MAHYSNYAENVGSQSAPKPPQHFANQGMSDDNAAAASRASGYK